MHGQGKSFKSQLLFSLILFSILSLLIIASIFFVTNRIYRNRIIIEIESLTDIITQSINNFSKVPEEYLIGIRNHIDEIHTTSQVNDENCIIFDVIDFTKTFQNVYLLDHNGIILNTWPYNENIIGIDMSNQEYFTETILPDTIQWSDTFISIETGLPNVMLTTMCNRGIIAANYNVNQLEKFITIKLPEKNDFIAVTDKKGNVIAHSSKKISVLTENLSRMNSIKAAIKNDSGVFEDFFTEKRGLASVQHARGSGFIILVFRAYEELFQILYTIYIVFPIILLAMIAVFGIFIMFFFRKFLSPLDNLQRTVRLVSSGSYDILPVSEIKEFEILIQSFIKMVNDIKERENDLKDTIKERDTLLRELNHRTKNNFQLITGIMRLYNLKNPESDPDGIMNKIQSKIETVSLVHEKLYKSSDLSSINFAEYIEELIPTLINSLSNPSTLIDYQIEVEKIYLLLDYAIPCGLILNEFIINSLKYAFMAKDKGKIKVNARITKKNRLKLTYSDNGVGLPETFDISNTDTLGFSIINNIIKSQLHGKIEILPDEGFSCALSFSLDIYKKRI